MKRILTVFVLAIALSFVSFVFGQDEYTVSGDVAYSKDATFYVCLHTLKTIQKWLLAMPAGSFTQTVKTNPSGKASFTFKGVPKGEYILVAFADENGNGKMDKTTWGSCAEPLWVYKRYPTGSAHVIQDWSQQKFVVDKDVTGITLK
jgi:uncharacterized protein (DUF2141 family)